jgi:hypothetical protein
MPREGKKNLFAALLLEPRFLNIGASCCVFLFGGFAFRALDSLGPQTDPALKQQAKNRFGPAIWDFDF